MAGGWWGGSGQGTGGGGGAGGVNGGVYIHVLHPGSSYVISQQVAGSGLYLVSGNDLVRDLNGPPSKPIDDGRVCLPIPHPRLPCVGLHSP